MTEEDILVRLQMLGYTVHQPGELDDDINITAPGVGIYLYRAPDEQEWNSYRTTRGTGDAVPLFQALLAIKSIP